MQVPRTLACSVDKPLMGQIRTSSSKSKGLARTAAAETLGTFPHLFTSQLRTGPPASSQEHGEKPEEGNENPSAFGASSVFLLRELGSVSCSGTRSGTCRDRVTRACQKPPAARWPLLTPQTIPENQARQTLSRKILHRLRPDKSHRRLLLTCCISRRTELQQSDAKERLQYARQA